MAGLHILSGWILVFITGPTPLYFYVDHFTAYSQNPGVILGADFFLFVSVQPTCSITLTFRNCCVPQWTPRKQFYGKHNKNKKKFKQASKIIDGHSQLLFLLLKLLGLV